MRILVTGKDGQVVRSLVERGAHAGHDVVPLGRPVLDLAGDSEAVIAVIKATAADAIVSAAAYTAVDKAESERERAFAINEAGAAAVAEGARQLAVPLVHLSTDYVFDGRKPIPYVETDPTGPTGVYGASKLAGEKAVLATYGNVAILRTAWVYSPFGANFVKTMLRLAEQRDEVDVVADQRGNPTSALDIADGILTVATHLVANGDVRQRGTFHMASAGDASWAEFAEAIFAASAAAGGPGARVRHIGAHDFPTAATRPANSRLTADRLALVHGVRLPEWRESTANVVARLVRSGA